MAGNKSKIDAWVARRWRRHPSPVGGRRQRVAPGGVSAARGPRMASMSAGPFGGSVGTGRRQRWSRLSAPGGVVGRVRAGEGLDDGQPGRRAGRDDPADLETGAGKQPAHVMFGALGGAEQQQHVQVHADRRRKVPGPDRQEGVDDDQAGLRWHRGPADAQDPGRVLVVPIVQNPREQVPVAAGGHGLEEVRGDERAAVGEPGRRQLRARQLERRRPVDQGGGQARRGLQGGAGQQPGTRADVDEPAQAGEVVGGHDGGGLMGGPTGHRGLEHGRMVRDAVEVGEERLPVRRLERRRARGGRGQQPLRRREVDLTAGQDRPPLRSGNTVAQVLTQWTQRELPVGMLDEDVVETQAAQHSADHGRVGAHLRGDRSRGGRPVREHVGQPQLRGHVQQLRGEKAVGQRGQPQRVGSPHRLLT